MPVCLESNTDLFDVIISAIDPKKDAKLGNLLKKYNLPGNLLDIFRKYGVSYDEVFHLTDDQLRAMGVELGDRLRMRAAKEKRDVEIEGKQQTKSMKNSKVL